MKFKHQKNENRCVKSQKRVDIKKFVKRSFVTFVAVVVFGTAYALILPAKTETVPDCGLSEHTHTEECYSANKTLVCEDITEEHIHTDECYTDEELLTCASEIHIHNEDCYHKEEVSNEEKAEENIEEQAKENADENIEEQAEENAEENAYESAEENPEFDAVIKQEEDLSKYVDFEAYVEENGGYIRSTLYDSNNNYIEHIYEASGEGYTYMLDLYSESVAPDIYIYYLPKGITTDVASKIGKISNGSSSIGVYRISDDCTYILFDFFEQSTTVQSIRGEIVLSVGFEELTEPAVEKKGYYISEDGKMDGFFHFEIEAIIPASGKGIPKKEWKIMDYSEISGSNMWTFDFEDEHTKDLRVSVSYGNINNREISNIKDVYNKDKVQMAYYIDSSTKAFYLVNRCDCKNTEDGCLNFDKDASNPSENVCVGLDSKNLTDEEKENYKGWCTCWNLEKDVELTIAYKNAVNGVNGSQIIANQNVVKSGKKNKYKNSVYLTGSYNNGSHIISETETSSLEVGYSNMVDKTEFKPTSTTGGHEMGFTLTINPDKTDFSKFDVDSDNRYDDKVIVLDNMENLKFIQGSMEILAEDTDGNKFELEYGKDFEIKSISTEKGNQLEIHLYKLGRYKYTIAYRATLVQDKNGNSVNIKNSVSLSIYGMGSEYSDPTYTYSRPVTYDDNWSYLRYMINILKVDYYNREVYLPGAEFELYSEDNQLIATAVTDESGKCLFETNTEKGIIFYTDKMYYIKEKTAPHGYELDTTKHWFYFGKNSNPEIEEQLNEKYPGINIIYVPLSENNEYILDMELTNEKLFTLPETGGNSTNVFIIAGVIVMAISLSCIILKNKIKKQSLRHSH